MSEEELRDWPQSVWRDEEADVNQPKPVEPQWASITLGPPLIMRAQPNAAPGPSPADILDRCKLIAAAKSHDYTTAGDLNGPGRFENFDRAEQIAAWFRSDVDKPYAVLIGVKLARLAALLSAKEPQNESIEDTFVDLTNYCALWGSRRSMK